MKAKGDRLRAWGVAAFAVLALGAIVAFLTVDWWAHRVPPWPRGAVMRVRLPEERFLFTGRYFRIAVVERQGSAIAVHWEGARALSPTPPAPDTLLIVRYPDGRLLESLVGPSRASIDEFTASRAEAAAQRFDFDGDGVSDRAKCDKYGRAWVESGASGAVLWEQRDPLEYEEWERLTPLGDLDGDGCSELAVLHPRQDRSKYDWEPLDMAFGATSWLTIVSGARATGR